MEIYQTLKLKKNEDVLTVTLHREHRANAVNTEMLKELIRLADWLREDSEIKFVIFTNQERFFSVGADLVELYDGLEDTESENNRKLQILGQEMMRKLENLEQITISAIQGSAYGAGVAIIMTTDFRYMEPSAVFNLPETNVGIFLTWGCTARLVKAVGGLKAKELIMLCEDIPAEECFRLGLVNKIVEKEAMTEEVSQLIEKLRNKGRHSIRMTKKLVASSVAVNVGDIFISEPELVERVMASGETKEKVQHFIDRRKK